MVAAHLCVPISVSSVAGRQLAHRAKGIRRCHTYPQSGQLNLESTIYLHWWQEARGNTSQESRAEQVTINIECLSPEHYSLYCSSR